MAVIGQPFQVMYRCSFGKEDKHMPTISEELNDKRRKLQYNIWSIRKVFDKTPQTVARKREWRLIFPMYQVPALFNQLLWYLS